MITYDQRRTKVNINTISQIIAIVVVLYFVFRIIVSLFDNQFEQIETDSSYTYKQARKMKHK